MGVVGVYLCTLSVRPPPLHRYLFVNERIKLQPQTINGNAVETVNARELHTFLESKQDFSTWIKNRIEKYEFVENADYLLHKFMEQTPSGAKHKTDYYVSVGMAKELAMVENNDKGKQARKYFIECEKKLTQPKPMTQIELIAVIANQMAEQERKSLELDNRLQVVEQKQQQLNQDNDHFTIKGFCSLHQLDLSNGKMSALSRKAKKLSDVKDYTYHEITDPRWGKVRTYHKDILTELFEFEQLL